MQQQPRDIMISVLNLLGFRENKEAYADEFIQICEKQALVDLLNTLSKERKEEIKQKMVGAESVQRTQAVLSEYVSSEQYTEALEKAAGAIFVQFVQAVVPTLSQQQVNKLQAYMQSFSSPTEMVK